MARMRLNAPKTDEYPHVTTPPTGSHGQTDQDGPEIEAFGPEA